ncbi:MAG: TonB-dependent receptor [Bacteroidales bacterium]|nr:TonB-dependent receptor [Bacteroidales bacterium]
MIVLLGYFPLRAQHPQDSVQAVLLPEVTIVESAYSNSEVIPSQRLSGETLQRMNSHSVADAIRYFSGVQIKDYGGIGGVKTVDIRSMGTNHLGVFYDGIQLGNAQNGQVDLGKFSLDNIEEVALYNGQKSDIFQSAKDFGSAGTIYLKTRRPTFDGEKKFNVRAIVRTGSFGLANPSVLWEQKITRRNGHCRDARPCVSTSINAEYIYATGKYKFRYRKVLPDGTVAWDTTAIRQNGDIQAYRVEGGVFGYAKRMNWNAKVYFYDAEKGIPGAIVNNVWKRSQRQWDRNFFTQASLTNEVNHRYSFLVNAKYAHDYMRYLNPDTTLIYIDNNFTQQEVYLSAANRFSILRKWDVALSTDFQWNTLDASLKNFAQPQRYTTLAALASSFEVWRLKAQASLLGTFVQDGFTESLFSTETQRAQSFTENKQEYTPAVFLSYKPIKKHDFNIRAFYKRIFRMPTFNDLYYTDIGNAALRPEYTTQYDVGALYTKSFEKGILETLTLNADAYYNEVSNKIVAIPKGNGQFRWMMMNIGYVEIRGIDAKAQFGWKLPHNIRLQTNINYTYQKAQDFSDPTDNDPVAGTYGGQIAYIPWHNGSFTLRTSYRSYELNYCFIYVGERYHNSSNIRENYEQPWYTHDVSLGKEFCFKTWNFKASAEINNIFNQQYDVVLNYPMPGTNFKIILRFEI